VFDLVGRSVARFRSFHQLSDRRPLYLIGLVELAVVALVVFWHMERDVF